MPSTVPGVTSDFVDRPIWDGLMGVDDEGAYLVGGACAPPVDSSRSACVTSARSAGPKETMREAPIGRSGRLYTYTIIHQLPPGYVEPFAVGYVDLADGIRVFAHIENRPECLVVGRRLRLTSARLRRGDDGAWLSGPRYSVGDDEEVE